MNAATEESHTNMKTKDATKKQINDFIQNDPHPQNPYCKAENECPSCPCYMGACKEQSDSHVRSCPKFFNYINNVHDFVLDWLKWEREHPEEAQALAEKQASKYKKWKQDSK